LKVLFVVTEDWFFCSHFLDRAKFLAMSGFRVGIASRFSTHQIELEQHGFETFPVDFSRRGINPIGEIFTSFRIRKIIKRFDPDVVHNIALKPVVTGTIGALLARHKYIVNALVGMGYIFTSTDTRASLLKPVLIKVLRSLFHSKAVHVVIENHDDFHSLIDEKIVNTKQISVIRGAGVDLDVFTATPEPQGQLVICMVARMLIDKGVREFVDAAKDIGFEHRDVQFWLVGEPDRGNPSTISDSEIESWKQQQNIHYLGRRSDIPEILRSSHIVCLPSYREGLPKSLIEALASGRPVVATDVPGCREVVKDHHNGLLVPPRDSTALASALRSLICDPEMRKQMGRAGRVRAENEFSNGLICKQTLDLYRNIGAL
jgi:glycosyltransferase involved in cell wall biosynthesis